MEFSISVAGEIWMGALGTFVLWVISGALAIVLGILLCAGSLSTRSGMCLVFRAGINTTRGVPTSLLVLAAGMCMLHLPRIPALPILFPGTLAAFQHVAWGVTIALALGSAGHLAEIFYASYAALGHARLDQASVMGLSRIGQLSLLAREAAGIAAPQIGARLVHHLHNTAFAALFPITELFGTVQGLANTSFAVFRFALIGALIYTTFSGFVWLLARTIEARLRPSASCLIQTGNALG